jgi:hypothetical protein
LEQNERHQSPAQKSQFSPELTGANLPDKEGQQKYPEENAQLMKPFHEMSLGNVNKSHVVRFVQS